MGIKDFMPEDNPAKRDEYLGILITQSMELTMHLVYIINRYADEIPDEMRDDIGRAVDNFMGAAGEFVNIEELCGEVDGVDSAS